MASQKEPLGRAISGILIRANAGYTDDYKIELQGAKYIQWGKVEEDIHALVDDQMEQNRAALAAAQQRIAELEQKLHRLLEVADEAIFAWADYDEPTPFENEMHALGDVIRELTATPEAR